MSSPSAPSAEAAAAAEEENPAAAGGGGRKRDREDALEEQLKRTKTTVCAAARHLVCAITRELPIDPVTAEDGFIYEEREISEWIRKKQADEDTVTSPTTNAEMGTKLLPAVQVRNNIRDLVENGIIDGELAEHWKEAMDAKEKVEKTKKKAEDGDVDAICNLALWYWDGSFGLVKNIKEAYKWYKQAADLKDTGAMAMAAWYFVNGVGVEKNIGQGIALTMSAAERGSDVACYNLAVRYLNGRDGLPEDKKEAIYWYKRAADGSCSVRHLMKEGLEMAKAKLEALEANE
mmetsp:Transcript_4399/g.9925  ORF Transcript_4399/g.9925 Transcript_4399/m.9925 type:complete len:290 (-) Transcript_4399:370-1239(-)